MRSIAVLLFVACAAAAQAAGRDVQVAAPDGTTLKGTYFPAERPGPAVLLLHMCATTRGSPCWCRDHDSCRGRPALGRRSFPPRLNGQLHWSIDALEARSAGDGSAVRCVVSPAYDLHPEFGLLCPSRSLRRRVRVALAFLAFLVIAGALAPKAGHDLDIDGVLMIAHGESQAGSNAEIVQTVGAGTATATTQGSYPPEGSKIACEGDAGGHADGKCGVGRLHPRRPRAANEAAPIAALPLGRSALPSSAASLGHVEAADAAVPAAAAADPPQPAVQAPKKVRKPSRSRDSSHGLARDRHGREDQWSARAYAPPDDRYWRDRYQRSWGWSW